MPWETRIELVNMHLFWKSQSSLEKIVMDMHAIRIDENFADILKEMKGFKDLKLILGSDKFEERCTVDVPQELVAELEVKHDFSKGSRTRQKISTELLNLVQKFPKTKKISFNAVQIDESAYELLGHLPSLEEISFENCQVVDYQGLKVKKLAFKNMKLQTTKVFLKVNQQVTELIVDEINMKDFLRARVQEIKKDA